MDKEKESITAKGYQRQVKSQEASRNTFEAKMTRNRSMKMLEATKDNTLSGNTLELNAMRRVTQQSSTLSTQQKRLVKTQQT